MIRGKRVVLVGKERQLVRKPDEEEGVRIVEINSGDDEVIDEEMTSATRSEDATIEADDVRRDAEQCSNEHYYPDTVPGLCLSGGLILAVDRSYFPSAAEPADSATDDWDTVTDIGAEGPSIDPMHDAEIRGSGIDLPEDVIAADAIVPEGRARSERSSATVPAASVKTKYATDIDDKESGGAVKGEKETVGSGLDQEVNRQEGLDLSDDVIIAVERRSGQYYFPAADADLPAAEQDTVTDIGAAGPGMDAVHDAEIRGSGIDLPEEVLIGVEWRSNQYYFPYEAGTGRPSRQTAGEKRPTAATAASTVPSQRTAADATVPSQRTSADATVPEGIEGRAESSTTVSAESVKATDSTDIDDKDSGVTAKGEKDTVGSGLGQEGNRGLDLPDDVILAVERRSNQYYFPPDSEADTVTPKNDAVGPGTVHDAEIRGSGIDLPEEALIGVEWRSNQYYFPYEAGTGRPSKQTSGERKAPPPPDTVVSIDEASPAIDRADKPDEVNVQNAPPKVVSSSNERYLPAAEEQPTALAGTRRDQAEPGTKSIDLIDYALREISESLADKRHTQPEPANVDVPSAGSGSRSPAAIDGPRLPEYVIRTVEKRSNEYFFAPDSADGTQPAAGPDHVSGLKHAFSSVPKEADPLGTSPDHHYSSSSCIPLEHSSKIGTEPTPDGTRDDQVPTGPDPGIYGSKPRSVATDPAASDGSKLADSDPTGALNARSLPPLDVYLFGSEDTDPRASARLFQTVELVEASEQEHLSTIDRPEQLPYPARFAAGANSDLPLDASTPLSGAPRFSPRELQSLLHLSREDSDDVSVESRRQPYGEVRLVSAEEGVERFPDADAAPEADAPRPLSRSLGPAFIDLPTDLLLPSPAPAQNYRTQRVLTEETITIEELTIISRARPDDVTCPGGSSSRDAFSGHYNELPEDVDIFEKRAGVSLVAAEDRTFRPRRFETWLSLEPPGDDDVSVDDVTSGVSPRDVNVDAAEAAYYRISQDAAPSLESSGEFEGVDHRLMSIQEILRLTDNCDAVKSSFGLDVIHEESEAERSGRSTRFEIVPRVVPGDARGADDVTRPSESASDVAARLLAALSDDDDDVAVEDSEDDGTVADWGQAVNDDVAVEEPFALDLEEDDVIDDDLGDLNEADVRHMNAEPRETRNYSIRDFALTPDAVEVYDSDGANPPSYRNGYSTQQAPEWIIASASIDDVTEHRKSSTAHEQYHDEASRAIMAAALADVGLLQGSEYFAPTPLREIKDQSRSVRAADVIDDEMAAEFKDHDGISLDGDVARAVEQRSDAYYGLAKEDSEVDDSEKYSRDNKEEVRQEDTKATKDAKEEDKEVEREESSDMNDKEVINGKEDDNEEEMSEIVDEKSSDDDGPTSTSSSPHEDERETAREGAALDDGVIRAVEERADAYYGLQKEMTSRPEVALFEAVDVRSATGADDGEVRLVHARDGIRVEKEQGASEGGSAEVVIRLESMDSPSGAKPAAPLMHPSVSRLGIDSRQPSLDRQSSGASDEMDRSSLMRLKLENNLDRATTSHAEIEGEVNTTDVEHFWDYRYNKSPRTMRELEAAKARASREAERQHDRDIRRKAKEDAESLDAEINRKLAEAEHRFLNREDDVIDTDRLHYPASSLSSPSFLVDRLSEGEPEENGNVRGISSNYFHLRSSSSSSASTTSFNSMGDGRRGRVEREGASRLTREGGPPTTELERLFPYIRHSSYYLHYYRSENLSMEKQAAPRNDYMLSRGLMRSTSTHESLGVIRQTASTNYIRDVDDTGRKSVTFRQRIEELVHTPPMHRRFRAGTAQIRSILKSQHASNLLKVAKENMLRELEQCVEERDRLTVNIAATPADVSQLSPMTQSAQTRYRNHMFEQKERISVMIEDKYTMIRETLREDEMPSWLRGKGDSLKLTLVDYKRPHRHRLFRRQSSSFFYQQLPYQSGPRGADLATANDCARKLERLKCQVANRDSEERIEYDNNDILSRISQRLSTSPNRLDADN